MLNMRAAMSNNNSKELVYVGLAVRLFMLACVCMFTGRGGAVIQGSAGEVRLICLLKHDPTTSEQGVGCV